MALEPSDSRLVRPWGTGSGCAVFDHGTLPSAVFAGRQRAQATLACAILVAAAVVLTACQASGDPDSVVGGGHPVGESQSSGERGAGNEIGDARAATETATSPTPATGGTPGATERAAIWGKECVSRRSDEFKFDGGDPRGVCVQRINALRAELRLPALARWTAGERCADATAKKAADTGNVHPSLPSECETGGRRAQNTCPGYASIEQTLELCMIQMWCEGPSASGEREVAHGHHQNMARDYTEVACGFYENAEGKVWQIQHFR